MGKSNNIKTVILCIGNILLGDEGIGVHVAKIIEKMNLPSYVKIIDGATAGFGLIPILETYKNSKFLIVDAMKMSNYSSLKDKSTRKSSFQEGSKKSNKKSTKGDIYTIPLSEVYNISKSNFPNLEFISFHQTGLMDVLNLLYMTSKIKINGYLIGINICDNNDTDSIRTFSMKLSTEIEQKIPKIIEILKKYI